MFSSPTTAGGNYELSFSNEKAVNTTSGGAAKLGRGFTSLEAGGGNEQRWTRERAQSAAKLEREVTTWGVVIAEILSASARRLHPRLLQRGGGGSRKNTRFWKYFFNGCKMLTERSSEPTQLSLTLRLTLK